MKIVFYSSNSNVFNSDKFHISTFPSVEDIFKNFELANKEKNEFYVVTQKPCFFLPCNKIIMPQESSIQDMADKITGLSPDIAIAFTFWVDPFDWLTINDSLIAEILEGKGIKTIAHNLKSGMTCFDKTKTHEKLKALGFSVANAVFVDHDMYFCAGSNKKVIHNVYKDYIASEIKKLTLPLIIKETMGVSSYGTTVVHSYGEAICYLNSKRNNSDRIVEEYITGRQFGCEIYGMPGNYSIMPPVEFSLNQYGITSPKLSVKYGPVYNSNDDARGCGENHIDELYKMLNILAEDMKLQGVAQFDLVYGNDKWYVIEINPRLSGMSYTYSAMTGKSLFEMVYESCVCGKKICLDGIKKVLNIKLPVIDISTCEKISKLEGVDFVHLTNNEEAKQEREKGYTEVIVTGDNYSVLKKNFQVLKNALPEGDFSTVDKFLMKVTV